MPSCLISTLRYRDAQKAIEWLCNAFGFEKKVVYPDTNGLIMHAELTFGKHGMIMIGSASNPTKFSQFIVQPDQIDGKETQTQYAVIEDIKAHYKRSKAAGAEILLELTTHDYGGTDYTCRDLEGHIWTFGNYDPWRV